MPYALPKQLVHAELTCVVQSKYALGIKRMGKSMLGWSSQDFLTRDLNFLLSNVLIYKQNGSPWWSSKDIGFEASK